MILLFFNSWSIRKKLIVLFTATAFLTVLIACITLWVNQFVQYRSTLRTEESAMARLVADSSGPALVFGDTKAANETLSVLHTDTRVKMACLYDKDGKLVGRFAATPEEGQCGSIVVSTTLFTRHHLLISWVVTQDGERVGVLYLEVGLSEMYKLLGDLAKTGLLVLLSSTSFALLLSSMLERLISRPIIYLTSVATQVSTRGDYLLRARRSSNDETGVLIEQFNVMMDRIQQREEELQSARNDLEGKVDIRTRELRKEIADRKVIESNLELAKGAAEDSSRAKSAFLANISHELRTPLNAIIGYSEMLYEDSVVAGIPSMSQDLEKVLLSARHLLTLISDVLDLSKLEAGQMQLQAEPVSTLSVLREVMPTVEILARRNRNHVEQVQPVWAGTMLTDVLRFRQCLLNLISNACKFTEDGVIFIGVELRLERDRTWILWSVRDSGIGISTEDQTKLFRTFAQLDSSTTRRHGGTGLGLVISQQLCHAMGGYISVESEVGRGSKFTIHMPADSSGEGRIGEKARPLSQAIVVLTTPTLMDA